MDLQSISNFNLTTKTAKRFHSKTTVKGSWWRIVIFMKYQDCYPPAEIIEESQTTHDYGKRKTRVWVKNLKVNHEND